MFPKRLFHSLLIACTLVAAGYGCADQQPCETMAHRICSECPKVAEHWQAACLCIDLGALREKGFKCMGPTRYDEMVCQQTLRGWDADSCALLAE